MKHQLQTATLIDNQYAYNPANQINQIAELTQTKTFGYDSVDRLTSMNNGMANENYAFDGVGNRTSSSRSTTYNYQPFNRVTATQTANYNNDANGNMVSKSEGSNFWHYVWDYENRLTTASTRKQTVRYRYDALGRRVQRYFIRDGGENTKFIYDGLDVVMDDNSGVLTKYQNGLGIDNKLKMVTNGTAKYFLQDHLGSTVSLADSSGAVVSSASYDSFGNSTNNLSTRYQYTGREYDSFTGLYYYRARWYNANLGRFISEDPIGFKGGDINLFAYVWSNPINYMDWFGTQGRSPNPQPTPPMQPASTPPSGWELFRDWLIQVWNTGIPFRIGVGQSTTGTVAPGVGEACSTLQLGPELYRDAPSVGEHNAAIYDNTRCALGDCTPRENPSWQDGLGPWSSSGYSTGYDARGQPRR